MKAAWTSAWSKARMVVGLGGEEEEEEEEEEGVRVRRDDEPIGPRERTASVAPK